MNYPEVQKYDTAQLRGGLSPMEETQRQRLERNKKLMLATIADIDRSLALLEKYPEMEELNDLLRRV